MNHRSSIFFTTVDLCSFPGFNFASFNSFFVKQDGFCHMLKFFSPCHYFPWHLPAQHILKTLDHCFLFSKTFCLCLLAFKRPINYCSVRLPLELIPILQPPQVFLDTIDLFLLLILFFIHHPLPSTGFCHYFFLDTFSLDLRFALASFTQLQV